MAAPLSAPRVVRVLTVLAWLQLALCVLPLTLAYALATWVIAVHLADTNRRDLRDFLDLCVRSGAGLLLAAALLRLLRPLWRGRKPAHLAGAAVLLVLLVPASGAGHFLLTHGEELLALAVFAAGLWACRRGLVVWPVLMIAAVFLLLLLVPTSRYLMPGAGLAALWLLVLRLRAYTLDRIPPLVWFGLALGVVFSVRASGWQTVPDVWQAGRYGEVLRGLYWGGGGAILCAATGLLAIWMGRAALEESIVDDDLQGANAT